jgi:hypothetical protein
MLDWFLGYFLFAFLFLLSFLIVFDRVQGALLFNMKFAKALEVRPSCYVCHGCPLIYVPSRGSMHYTSNCARMDSKAWAESSCFCSLAAALSPP